MTDHPFLISDFRLTNRKILITGAAGYLGRAISLGVAAAGGTPILCGRSVEKLEQLAEKIERSGGTSHIHHLDVCQRQSIIEIGTWLIDEIGSLHGIVNCAHKGRPGTISSSTEEDFEIAQQVHATGPFLLAQQCIPLLQRSAESSATSSSIVNIASMYGMVSPDPGIYGASGSNSPPYYGTAKAGLIQLTRYLACHLAKNSIRVNSVSPGPFPPLDIEQRVPDFYDALCRKNPMNRIGEPREIAGPVVFLLSAASSYMTGANLAVDGGWTSW